MLGPPPEKHLLFEKPSNSSYLKKRPNGHMGQDSNGWEVIRYTPWKINRGPKNHPNVYVYTKKGGKPSSKPPFLGAMLIFQGVETAEGESYVRTPTKKKQLLFEKSSNSSI